MLALPYTHDPSPLTIRPRSLFTLRASDALQYGSLVTIAGLAGTFARGSNATIFDEHGAVCVVPSVLPRVTAIDLDGDGVREAVAVLLERAATNLVLRSENFGTTWTATNSPTRTAAAKRCGDVVLDLIGDNSGANVADYRQTIAFTGNGVKGVSIFCAKGTSPAANGSRILLVDTTASANRLAATITWNADGSPNVTAASGTYLGADACANGVYRLHFITTSVTAANTNSVRIEPAVTSAQTGNLYAGGVQAENTPYPTSYIPTAGSTATRNAETLTFSLGWRPRDLTYRLRFARPLWMRANANDLNVTLGSTERRLLEVGGGSFSFALRCLADGATHAGVSDGSFANGTAVYAGNVAALATLDVVAQMRNVATNTETRLAYGDAAWSAWTALSKVAPLADEAVGYGTTPLITLGGTNCLDAAILQCTIAGGLREPATIRTLL